MPWFCSSATTPFQLAASAKAPCTRTTVGAGRVVMVWLASGSTGWSGCTQGGAQRADSERDRGLGGVCLAQGVEHHEVVDDGLEAHRGDGDPGFTELVGVRLALVAQDV